MSDNITITNAVFQCTRCRGTFPALTPRWACTCGGNLRVVRTIEKEGLLRAFQSKSLPDLLNMLGTGYFNELPDIPLSMTPVFKDRKKPQVTYKFEGSLPSGSYKDRGAAFMVSVLKAAGVKEIVEDSSGNAGAAIAMCSAALNINCTIVCPSSATGNKLRFIRQTGAELELVEGIRENAALRAFELSTHAFYASHVYCPWFIEGVKSLAYEIYIQYDGKLPLHIILPLGNGSLLLGLCYGLKDLYDSGLIHALPKITVVQAEVCAPVYAAFHNLKFERKGFTIAEGISNAEVARKDEILYVLNQFEGSIEVATEEEIKLAHSDAFQNGICMEPTSAVVMCSNAWKAGVSEETLIILSGTGLKTL